MNDIPWGNFSPEDLKSLMGLFVDAVCVVDPDGRFLYVSAAAESVFGYTPDEMIGMRMIDLVHPSDRDRTLQSVGEVVAHTNKPNFENRYVRKDGVVAHIMWTARWSPEHQVRVAIARDITERRRIELRQAALYAISEAAFAAEDLPALFAKLHEVVRDLLPATSFSVSLYDEETDVLSSPYHVDEFDHAPAAGGLMGGSLVADVVRDGRTKLLSRDISPVEALLYQDLGDVVDWLGVPMHSKKGVRGALIVKSHKPGALYSDSDIDLLGFIAIQVAAAIDRKNAEMQMLHLAHHDGLTGLVNRTVAEDRISISLARARRDQSRVSVLYLDLDMFKQVNDSFGHSVGDALLREVATRITREVRQSDTVARMGGDEFLVLLSDVHTLDDASVVAEKIRLALSGPFYLVERNLCVSPSIGLSSFPEHGDDVALLIRRADDAMYVAKTEGGNRLSVAIPAEPAPALAMVGLQ